MISLTALARTEQARKDPVLRALPGCSRWVLSGLFAGLVVGLGVVLATPAVDRATEVVELTEVSTAVDLTPAPGPVKLVTVDTDAQLLLSDLVIDEVARVVGRSAAHVRQNLTVEARPITRVIEITYSDVDPGVAMAGVQQARRSLLAAREELVLQRTVAYLDGVEQATADPRKFAGTEQNAEPGRILSILEGRRQRAQEAGIAIPEAGRVLTEARLTQTQDRGDMEMPLASGAATGALAGFLGWMWWRRRRRRPAAAPAGSEPGPALATTDAVQPTAVQPTAVQPAGSVAAGAAPEQPVGPASQDGRGVRGPFRPPTGHRRRSVGLRWRQVALWSLLLTLAGTVVGAVAASFVPQVAVAQTSYVVLPLRGNAFSSLVGDTLIDLRTEAQLPTSQKVLEAVAARSGFTVDQLRRRTSVSQVEDARVIVVTFRGRNPGDAAQQSVALVGAALDERVARAERAEASEIADLTAQRDAAQQALAEVLDSEKPEARDVRVLSQRMSTISQQLGALETGTANPGYQVATSDLRADANRSVRVGAIGVGAAAGLLAGLLHARVLLPRLRNRAQRRARRPGPPASRRPPAGASPAPVRGSSTVDVDVATQVDVTGERPS